jgi:predicted nuclease of predicted toxin-antitoxin system
MKIKLDENLPNRLVNLLIELGHEVDTVPEEGLAGHNDLEIWEVVQKEGYFFIT